MTEKFECKGYWYLPSDPDNTIAGILTYIPNESIKLELIGTFEKSTTIGIITFDKRTSIDIILGITSDAHKISLINCHPGGGSYNLSCSFPITRFSIQYCLDGIHIENFKDKIFSWSDITISELTTWCYPAALESVYGFSEKDKINKISVSVNTDESKKPIISVDVNNLTTLNLKKDVHFNGSEHHLNPTFKQSTFLQIQKSNKSSISDFLSDIYLFEKFMSLASLSTIKVANISLYDEENYQELDNKEKIFHQIELFYVQRGVETVKTKELDFLISFSQIQDIFPEIIRKWYSDTSEIIPIRAHLVQSVKNKNVFDSTDFLIVIQAIEGFCIRFRKEQSLTKELEDLLNEFKDVDKVKLLESEIKSAVDSRHYYSHFMNKSKKPNTLDGLELYILTKKLRILLICCLLNFIGIENKRINKLLNESNNSKLE